MLLVPARIYNEWICTEDAQRDRYTIHTFSPLCVVKTVFLELMFNLFLGIMSAL